MEKSEVEKFYKELIAELKEKMDKAEITAEEFLEILDNSSLITKENRISIGKDEETGKAILNVSEYDSDAEEYSTVNIDGQELNDIIDQINEQEKRRAKEKIEEITEQGIGETKVLHDYYYYNLRDEDNFRGIKNEVMGVLNEEENSPYVLGGKLTEDNGLTELRVEVPYREIVKDVENFYLLRQIEKMTPEQIERYNHKSEQMKELKEKYEKGDYNAYRIPIFKVNDEEYSITKGDYGNGGVYTILKKKAEKNSSREALGVDNTHSKWGSVKRAVKEQSLLEIIAENPRRFAQYYAEHKGETNCCGRYPTETIDYLLRDLMGMEPESVLTKKELEEQRKAGESLKEDSESKFESAILKSAEEKERLEEKEKQAKELLQEYEKQEKQGEK